MRNLFYFVLLCVLSFTTYAQKKVIYDANAEKRHIASFHSIKVSHGIHVLLKQGDEEAIAISAIKQEYADAVQTEVINGELHISIKKGLIDWWQQIREENVKNNTYRGAIINAYVSFKELTELTSSSGARITIDSTLTGNKLSLNLSSGAWINGELAVSSLDVSLNSGAKSTIKGKVQKLKIKATSGAHLNAYGLKTDEAEVDVSSSGKVSIEVTKILNASATTGGTISYKGLGNVKTTSKNLGGKIKKVI
jgi:hypothetical protein